MGREPDLVRRNRELQRALYGEPLGDRLRRLLARLDISQARLAHTLGVSPAMISQLISGRRAKIGTSDVLGRLVLLERHLAGVAAPRPDPRAVDGILARVRDARPLIDVGFPEGVGVPAPRTPGEGHQEALAGLRAVAEADELSRAADALDRTAPSLAAFLRRAAR